MEAHARSGNIISLVRFSHGATHGIDLLKAFCGADDPLHMHGMFAMKFDQIAVARPELRRLKAGPQC